MNNRDLLKEAIADAKTVKDTAIANAKAALEEAFTPFLKEKLAAKLAEMDENETELDEMNEKDMDESKKSHAGYGKIDTSVDDWSDDHPKKKTSIAKYGDDETEKMGGKTIGEEEEMYETELEEYGDEHPVSTKDALGTSKEDEELDLDALLKELDELKEDLHEEEELINNRGGAGNLPKYQDMVEEEEYEDSDADGIEDSEDEIDIENMDEDDLKSFIESVIADMVEAGELEAGHEGEGEEEEGEEGEEEEGGEMMAEVKKMKKEVEEAKKAKEKAEKELKEAYDALKTIKTELNEVNLFNAKLLYTNKIFKSKNLTESQKVKVLAAFDKAASVKEAKLVFETLSEGMKETKKTVNESLLRGSASKPAGIIEKKPILEVNNQYARWQQLAGINKNKNNN